MAAGDPSKFRFCIDRGGTFTDVYAEVPTDGSVADSSPRVVKLLSEDPANYPNAPREGIRRVLEEATGTPHPRDKPLDASRVEWIRMGTTVATNGLLEREGERFLLVVTKGFRDALEIGNQARPDIFDIKVKKVPLLYEKVEEVHERVRVLQRGGCAGGADEAVELGLDPDAATGSKGEVDGRKFTMGTSGEWVEILEEIDLEDLRAKLEEAKADGITSVAFAFTHSYAFGEHESAAGDLAREMGFTQVSVSSELLPMVRLVPRGQTACVDAYLTPFIVKYLDSFTSGFKKGTLALGPGSKGARVSFMQSDGGLTAAEKFSGFRAILSGPAGGVVGYAVTTQRILGDPEEAVPCIGFDMGGTSTDVSRFAGTYEQVFETETAGVKILCPQLDISTVAAGGGSRLFFRTGVLVVGPESSKAHPGPVCYRKNGYLAVTDANLFLGRLLPQHFPNIFGPNEDLPLDTDATAKAMKAITADVNAYNKEHGAAELTPEQVASGFLKVANETMCRPIRELSESRGFNPAEHVLSCFGGAGAQHVCAIARTLGISTAVVHSYAGILSAYGMGLADVVVERQVPCALKMSDPTTAATIGARHTELERNALEELKAEGFPNEQLKTERFLNLRYEGTDNALMVMEPPDGDFSSAMNEVFKREYGFALGGDRELFIDDIRVRAVGKSALLQRRPVESAPEPGTPPPLTEETTRVYFEETGWVEDVPVYMLDKLLNGNVVAGPAIIMNGTSTIVVEPKCKANVTEEGDVRIELEKMEELDEEAAAAVAAEAAVRADPIQLSVFANRFMSIAEQMGRTLQRTSTSVNIKERLDFSCAIFGSDCGLVANAPHVPVHLGAMADTVRVQVGKLEGKLQPGDVIVANDPSGGGSHLPDITVITPVFPEGATASDDSKPMFYCASRGHHADVGGSTPGSMPADSTTLVEEGAVIDAFLLVKGGVFDEAGIVDILNSPAQCAPPADKPNIQLAGCRNMSDVLSDLKAQVAANAKGIGLLHELMRQYTEPVVLSYMGHVQNNAAQCVRQMLKDYAASLREEGYGPVGETGQLVVDAVDYMDDGNPIKLKLSINDTDGTVHFDFTGTGPQVLGNWNSPSAITTAAVIYCMRILVGRDIPLNSGCLEPVTIEIPEGSMLSPCRGAAVCAGNVLTSMRITDVILKAFGACAASQGCMNNFTFGDAQFGYYETIAGGSGAGPDWQGTSAVQCHMTNTRMTDVEIMEKRYPVLVEQFSVRKGSGGLGSHSGGDGVVREIKFLRDGIVASLLTERRGASPYGLKGGADGSRGRNILIRRDKEGAVTQIALSGKCKLMVDTGDTIRIETPGGGGYGPANGDDGANADVKLEAKETVTSVFALPARRRVAQHGRTRFVGKGFLGVIAVAAGLRFGGSRQARQAWGQQVAKAPTDAQLVQPLRGVPQPILALGARGQLRGRL